MPDAGAFCRSAAWCFRAVCGTPCAAIRGNGRATKVAFETGAAEGPLRRCAWRARRQPNIQQNPMRAGVVPVRLRRSFPQPADVMMAPIHRPLLLAGLLLAGLLLAAPAVDAASFAGTSAGASSAGSSGSSGSTSGDDKRVLQAREDAAGFLASDGRVRSAQLEAALRMLREQDPDARQASDLELARRILAGVPAGG